MAVTRLETRLTARDDTGRAFRSLQASMATADRAFVNLTKVAAGLGAVFGGIFIRDLVDVNKKFQSLQASLVTFTGSTEKAKGAFNILKEFAKTTPFSLDEVVGSFNVLIAQGIKPTEAQLRNFADIAGGTSKSILQFSEAIADASVGEFERLKEFGIKTKKEGETITFSIGDLTKSVNNDADSILAALAEIGATKFADGAARQAETLGGSFTNLRDTIDEFMFEVGEAGLAKELSKTVRSFTSVIGGNKDLAKSLSDTGVKAIRYFVDAIRFMRNNLDTLYTVLQIVFGAFIVRKIVEFGLKLFTLVRIMASVTLAIRTMNASILVIPALIAAAVAGTAALIGKFDELKKGVIDLVREADEFLGVTKGIDGVMEELGLTTKVTTSEIDDFKDIHEGLGPVLDQNIETLRELAGGTKDAGKAAKETFGEGAIRGVKEYFESIKSYGDNAAEFTGNAFKSLEGTLSEFFQTGKINFSTFTDAVKRGLADLAAKAVITTGINFLGSVFPSLKFADGGIVPGAGGPREDNILARLSSGEYVIQASSVNKFGRGFFDKLNAGQMPGGNVSIPGEVADEAFPGYGFGFKKIFKKVKKAIGGIGDLAGKILKDPIGSIKTLVTNFDDVLFGAGAYEIAMGIITGDPKRIIKGIENAIGMIKDSVMNMINGIISGDPMTIALLASSFILPGVGASISSALGPALGGSLGGFMTGVTTGISNSFAAGILGSGSLSAIAASVGMEFAKGAVIDALSAQLSNAIVPGVKNVQFGSSAYAHNRADAFATLYNKSAPYLARAQGGPVSSNDNVLVGERGPEMFIPNRNGTIAPIKSNGGELIKVIVSMKDEIVSLRRDMARVMSGQALAGSRV
jgi:hypothetical protein